MRGLAIALVSVLGVLGLAACGDGNSSKPDAPVPDSTPDTPFDPVSLTIRKEGVPQKGVHVYFQNADSSLVADATTDGAGQASARMAAGGYVTAIEPFDTPQLAVPYDDVKTFAGVKPGDQLVLELPLVTSIRVTLVAPLSGAAGVARYYAYAPCNVVNGVSITPVSGPPTGTIDLNNCGTMTDFIIAALDSNLVPIEYIYAANVAISDGGTVDLSGLSYVAAPTRTFMFTNAPAAGLAQFTVYDTMVSPRGQIARFSALASNNMLQLKVPAFNMANDIWRASARSAVGRHTLVDWGPYTDTVTVDVGARMLPDMTLYPAFDTHSVSWGEAATGATPDFTMLAVSACRNAEPRCWDWFVVAPHTSATVTLPTLPTTLHDYNLVGVDTQNVFDLVIAKVPGGYDGVRAGLFSAVRPIDLVTGPSGSMTYEEMIPP